MDWNQKKILGKGGNDPWSPLKTNLLVVDVPTISTTLSVEVPGGESLQFGSVLVPDVPVSLSLPTLLECSICRKDGVYDRFEAATRAASNTPNVSRTFAPDGAGWAGDIVRGPLCHGETYDDQPPTESDRFEPVRFDVDICAVSPDAGSEYMDMPDAVPEYIDMAELRFDP